MTNEHLAIPETDDPRKLATNLIIDKNRWLTSVRWVYTLFIFIFLVVFNYFSSKITVVFRPIGLIVLLSLLGNIIFIFTLKRHLKFTKGLINQEVLATLAVLQLDFDLVVLSLFVFFSGGFESPVIVLFIFYILVATFLFYHQKAFKNTLTAMVLVVVIFFTNEGLIVSSEKLTAMIGFNAILLVAYLIAAYLSRNLKENEEKLTKLLTRFQELSVTDGLTDLYNQTHFFLLLNLQLERSRRYGNAFSLILFDVDNFKNYNDSNGHIAGSEALRKVAHLMRKVFRASDMLAKYGGDEFVVILPNSDKIGAFLGAERIREMVENEIFTGVTLSLGIASYPEHGTSTRDILDRADRAMYFAKQTGRNKTVIYNRDLEDNPNQP